MEDFVTCEIAKKLKEKGFSPKYDIPTTFHVLKWLRDEKKIHINTYPTLGGFYTDIYIDVHKYYDGEAGRWMLYSHKEKTLTSSITFENATECALRYVLDNLI